MQGAISSGSRGVTVWRPPPTYHHGMSPEETTEYLQRYREWFEEDRSIPPEPAPLFDRSVLISEQLRRRAELERTSRRGGGSGIQVFMTIVGFAKHSSATPIQELQPVRFADMLVRRAHVGNYLLCRIVAPCSRMVAIQSMIEDVDGVAYDLSIYNFPSTFDCTLGHLDALFPVGTILAIREPTFKAPMQGDRPLVRVDSPTDICFVVPGSPLLDGVTWRTGATVPRSPTLPTTLDAWQQHGNNYFKASQWFLAAFAYSQGLAIQPDAAVLFLNRAEAYLRMNYYSGALCDAQRVLSTEGTPDAHVGKAVFRLAKAHYGRGEYAASQQSFVQWKNAHTDDSAADTWIERCRARQTEQSTGHYDWPSLFRTAKQKIRLDVADYTGAVEIRTMAQRGGGRGVVATKDVQAGDLLMVTKPFVSVYASDLPRDRVVVTLDLISNMSKERTDAALLARIIDKIYGNPDLHDEVFHLYAGPDYPPPPSTYPPAPRGPISVELLNPNVDIDIAALEAICTYNNFNPYRIENHHADDQATGLYPRASLFNHSCSANALWYCIGDVMIIRAAGPIPAGTEITIPYSVKESYYDRQADLKKHMLEYCTCSLCEEDRKDGHDRLRKRDELEKRVSSTSFLKASLAEARAFEKDVRETFRPTRGPIRPLLALALHAVAEKLRASGNARQLREALRQDIEALRCFGLEIPEGQEGGTGASTRLPIGTDRFPSVTSFFEPTTMMLRVACTYLNLDEEANAVRWMKAALWLTNASIGGGKELFMLVHEEALKQMNIHDYAAKVL
ncbi:hypothetical protein L227DRAFT_515885 [Lentinus tigrinus ALCF2SS1-6]|uniref:SET domain-containing protein n=2 Tax=Lentinus tigrinus TaxID=5365 RepID=A0A5C2SUG9_9APHY|nr:hypothetical protein L227DRAFT_515885 [Lentinus tigrinus ALCF2SS1-6]